MRALHRWTFLVLFGCLAGAASAGNGNVYLAQAKVFYQGLEFEKCLARLDQASRMPDNSQAELAEVELYNGLCRFNLGKRDDAETNFKLALQLNPDVSLPPGTSPRIAAIFDPLAAKAREDRDAELAAQQKKSAAEQLDAPREVTLAPAPATTNAVPSLSADAQPGGSKVLPLALGGTSVAAGVAAVIFGSMAKAHETQANNPATFYSDAQRLGQDAQREALIANVALGVAGAAAAGAVITWLMAE